MSSTTRCPALNPAMSASACFANGCWLSAARRIGATIGRAMPAILIFTTAIKPRGGNNVTLPDASQTGSRSTVISKPLYLYSLFMALIEFRDLAALHTPIPDRISKTEATDIMRRH